VNPSAGGKANSRQPLRNTPVNPGKLSKAARVSDAIGYTLRDRPLYYQSVYSGPFSERLVVIR